MNTYITLACLLAVAATAHSSAIGLGLGKYGLGAPLLSSYAAPIWAPAAVSTANIVRAAPIPIVRTVAVAPVISAPVIKTVAVGSYGLGGLGWGGYGLSGSSLGGYGLGGSGLGGYGWNGIGLGSGLGWKGGWGGH